MPAGMTTLLSTLLLSTGLQAPTDSLGPYRVEFREVVPGVTVATRPGYARLPVQGNVTVIFNEGDVVAVDAGAAPIAARQVIRYIRGRTDRPVSTLVVTHGHEDHVLGIQEWVDAWPDIQVLSQDGTRDYVISTVTGRVGGFADGVEDRRAAGLRRVEEIRSDPSLGGDRVADHLARFYEHDLDVELAEYAGLEVTPPNATFRDRMVLHRPGRTIEILHRPGKTRSDVVVRLPEEGVLVAGDILTHPIPYGFAADQREWIEALGWLADEDARYLIPGHGDVLTDGSHLRTVLELAEHVNGVVADAVRGGADVIEARERVDVGVWKDRLVGDDPVLRRYFDLWFTDPAVERAFDQLHAESGGTAPAPGEAASGVLFSDGFEGGLDGWEPFGAGAAFITDSGDPAHGRVLVLRPNGDAHVLVRGSETWGDVRVEGEVLFPEDEDSYLGILYDFRQTGGRMDFGNVYIKGNGSYVQVNPHRDYNVGRTLYPEHFASLRGEDSIRVGRWERFRAEIVGPVCHLYVGDMTTPKVTFPYLGLRSGAVGLQPRSVGGDVWVDDVTVTSIDELSYPGPPRPRAHDYDLDALLTTWEVLGPLAQTRDDAGRFPAEEPGWRPFPTDGRGAVVTGSVVDSHGPRSVAYFRTRIQSDHAGPATLHLSTIDDLAIWVNGRFHWFVDRDRRAWYDFWRNPDHEGQRIPLELVAGGNEIVIRVRGGVYATGGFFARLERGGP